MKNLFFIIGFMSVCFGLNAQNSYEREVFVSSEGNTLNYRLLTPEKSAKVGKYPLVIFLHGAGERGNDNERQLIHGAQMFLNPVNREKYPAYVIFPQCPENDFWAYSKPQPSWDPHRMPEEAPVNPLMLTVMELIDRYLALPDIDSRRVYIMGLSMGGIATFDLAIRFPDTFAAAIPICGTVNPARLSAARGVEFRIFHGDNDATVPVEGSRAAYKALKEAGIPVEYYELPGVDHFSWNPAFNFPDFMEWLFSQRKK